MTQHFTSCTCYNMYFAIYSGFFFIMPKSIPCVICCKRVTTACRRSMKGKRNEMQRQNLGALIGKRITENDYICTKCILEHQRGHLQKKLPPPGCSLSPDHDIFYMRGNTDKNCSICNLKKNTWNWFQMKTAQTFFWGIA